MSVVCERPVDRYTHLLMVYTSLPGRLEPLSPPISQ